MSSNKSWAAAWVIGGALLGAPVRVALGAGFGDEMVLLGAINAVGWFILGLASGRWGSQIPQFRAGLGAFGVMAFTSWVSLAFQGIDVTGDILIAAIEVAFGMIMAVIGHLVTMPRGRDL